MHIANIAGNIGEAGTTLTTLLAKHYGWNPQFEEVDNNPYIEDFYNDMQRWSFNLQIFFLNTRFNNLVQLKDKVKTHPDRTIYEDAYIFAPNLHAMGLMSTRDFETYSQLFETMKSQIKGPDLMIYLRATIPTLVNNIQKRGRDFEDSIRLDYLKRLNERYEAWVSKYKDGKMLIIDIDNNNFAEKKEDFGEIINKVERELNGLFK